MNGIFKQKYGLILFISIFTAMSVTYWFGIRKVMEIIRVERDDIQKMLVIRENREHQLSRLAEYDVQYETIVQDEKWLDVFTARDNMIEFVRRLESLAEEEGVVVVLEAREAPKSLKKIQTAADLVKADKKESDEKGAESATKEKQDKKDPSILESLPSTTYTYLGLRVTGETKKVVRYLHKVEMLPVALDMVSIEAIRKENTNFSEKTVQAPVPNPASDSAVLSVESTEPQINPFAIPEIADLESKPAVNAFELEVTAGLVVYHPKE